MTQVPSLPPTMPAAPFPPKPGKVQAIAIMCLVDGILNILYGCGLGFGLLCSLLCACFAPIGVYPIVLGILEILYATKLMTDPIRADKPAQYLAIMQIVNIITGDAVSLAIGIISLVFYSDPEVTGYFEAIARGPRTV
jgi:hypothetical protein